MITQEDTEQAIRESARDIADRSGHKRISDNWSRIYQAAFAGIKIGREQAAQSAFDRLDPALDLQWDELTECGKERRIAAFQAWIAIRALT